MKISVKKALLWLTSVVCGSVIVSGAVLFSWVGDVSAALRFWQTYCVIHKDYFREISDTKLWDSATDGMVQALDDPYSALLMGDNYDNFMKQTTGEYGGIGVVVGMDADNAFHVVTVFPKSAAEDAGILPGDAIVSVDSLSAEDATIEEIAQAIRGESGSVVTLHLLRDGEALTKDVTRSQITVPTVEAKKLTDEIGYLHVYSFSQNTAKEFREKLADLKAQGAQKLVLDLRMNPGGMVDVVTEVAGELLTGGTIVSYHSKNGILHSYDVKGAEKPMPLAVLIDRNSASAAEILAGAVQDKKEGVVIGETSYGKGTMQMVMPLAKDEVLKLSIAEYLTAAGRKIDQVGITPDIEIKFSGQLFDSESDSVILKAVEVLNAQE